MQCCHVSERAHTTLPLEGKELQKEVVCGEGSCGVEDKRKGIFSAQSSFVGIHFRDGTEARLCHEFFQNRDKGGSTATEGFNIGSPNQRGDKISSSQRKSPRTCLSGSILKTSVKGFHLSQVKRLTFYRVADWSGLTP